MRPWLSFFLQKLRQMRVKVLTLYTQCRIMKTVKDTTHTQEEKEMAVAEARCTCKVCGEQFVIRVTKRNRREANEFEEWAAENIDVCTECKRKAELEEAKKTSEGLPELTGSEKQIAWAIVIRAKKVQDVEEALAPYLDSSKQNLKGRILDALKAKSEAKFWIDARNMYPREIIDLIWKEIKDQDAQEDQEEAEPTEQVIEPEEQKSSVLCTVSYEDSAVFVRSDYDRDIINTVKANGYKWDGSKWCRKITITSGDAEDRAAEIANILLCKGYPVKVPVAIAEVVIRGAFEPEHKRWLFLIDNDLILRMEDGSDVYGSAIRISGAKSRGRYDKTTVKVPVAAWEEIMEFVRMHDFRVSPGAQKKIDEYRQSVTKVVPTAVSKQYHDDESAVTAVLSSSRDVLEDLKEED